MFFLYYIDKNLPTRLQLTYYLHEPDSTLSLTRLPWQPSIENGENDYIHFLHNSSILSPFCSFQLPSLEFFKINSINYFLGNDNTFREIT